VSEKLFDGETREDWLSSLVPVDMAMARHAMAVFALFGIPENYLDVGCGTGAMVRVAHNLGVNAYGLDQLGGNESWLPKVNLREDFDLRQTFEIVSCVEVAEHIPPENQATFITALVRHVALGGVLVFTSPWPSMANSSHSHVNMRYPHEWRKVLYDAGLSFSFALTIQLGMLWSSIWSPLMWLAPTLQVFTKGTPDLPSGVGQ